MIMIIFFAKLFISQNIISRIYLFLKKFQNNKDY
jgi:hypothetical protein